jgi:hypothetical protein
MSDRRLEIVLDGIVHSCSREASSESCRVTIVGTGGREFEIEPTYLGAYLRNFDGRHIIARGRVVAQTPGQRVFRLSSLRVIIEPEETIQVEIPQSSVVTRPPDCGGGDRGEAGGLI